MRGPQRSPRPEDHSRPTPAREFTVGKSLVGRVFERVIDKGMQAYLVLTHRGSPSDGTTQTGRFVCNLEEYEQAYTRAMEIIAERQRERQDEPQQQQQAKPW